VGTEKKFTAVHLDSNVGLGSANVAAV